MARSTQAADFEQFRASQQTRCEAWLLMLLALWIPSCTPPLCWPARLDLHMGHCHRPIALCAGARSVPPARHGSPRVLLFRVTAPASLLGNPRCRTFLGAHSVSKPLREFPGHVSPWTSLFPAGWPYYRSANVVDRTTRTCGGATGGQRQCRRARLASSGCSSLSPRRRSRVRSAICATAMLTGARWQTNQRVASSGCGVPAPSPSR